MRGKVESIQATEPETVRPEEHTKQAARYFRLALQYAVAGSQPMVLVVMGRVGTGKTSVAKQLAKELDWPIFSSDETRKNLAGVPLLERTPPSLREKLYSEQMTKETYKKLVENGLAALATHSGVILDATFSSRRNRNLLRGQCAKAHATLQAVELDVDLEEVKKRLKARDRNAAEISDARLEDFEKLNATYEPPSELAPDLIRISAPDSFGIAVTVKTVLLGLGEKSVTRTDSSVADKE